MTILLILVYVAFISLGLPDSILGAALPSLLKESGLPLSAGSLLSAVIIGSTIVSSFMSPHVIKRLGTGRTVFISCLMTGGALLGFSAAPAFYWLVILGIPLGLGGGAVDTALNNFIALYYKAHHMNWLHSFWGVGATVGPLVMSWSLATSGSWRPGYFFISLIQLSLAVILLFSLPLWNRTGDRKGPNEGTGATEENWKEGRSIWKIPGVTTAFSVMMLYCTVEGAIGLWGSSFLVESRQFSAEHAASLIAFYFGGITAGRFLSGILTFRFSNAQMIRMGVLVVIFGLLVLSFQESAVVVGISVVVIGMGLAPVFPSMLHETPKRFGKENSQVLIGYQMGFAYVGSALLSPGIGLILQMFHTGYLPVILLIVAGALVLLSERLNRRVCIIREAAVDC